MACLDTTILIDLTRRASPRREQAIRKIEELTKRGQRLGTTRFNVAELYVGLSRSRHPEEMEETVDALLDELEIFEFNDAAAKLFGFVTGFLQQIGKPAGDMDVLIAATAMVYGHALITRNPRHFRHIPLLVVEEY
jgi:predicted nucleic acid-binding protein